MTGGRTKRNDEGVVPYRCGAGEQGSIPARLHRYYKVDIVLKMKLHRFQY